MNPAQVIDWTEPFLAALREKPVITLAARAAGVSRWTVQRRRDADKDFAERMQDALEEGWDIAEYEAYRRGVVGYEEPVIYQGQLQHVVLRNAEGEIQYDATGNPIAVPLTIRKHSDAMLTLILKGRRKATFAERTELTGADGKDLDSGMDDVTRAARVAQILALAARRRDGTPTPEDLA